MIRFLKTLAINLFLNPLFLTLNLFNKHLAGGQLTDKMRSIFHYDEL